MAWVESRRRRRPVHLRRLREVEVAGVVRLNPWRRRSPPRGEGRRWSSSNGSAREGEEVRRGEELPVPSFAPNRAMSRPRHPVHLHLAPRRRNPPLLRGLLPRGRPRESSPHHRLYPPVLLLRRR